MTSFHEIAGSDNFLMRTGFPDPSYSSIEQLSVFGLNKANAVNEIISMHRLAMTTRAAGAIILARTPERLEVLEMPDLTIGDEEIRNLSIQVRPQYKEYLEPLTDEDNPSDLLDLWKSATSFYTDIIGRHALGQTFVVINHDLSREDLTFSVGPLA